MLNHERFEKAQILIAVITAQVVCGQPGEQWPGGAFGGLGAQSRSGRACRSYEPKFFEETLLPLCQGQT
jgi:hypothetical protein